MSTLLVNDISNYSGSTIDITVPTVTASGDLTVAGVVTGDTLDAVDTATTRTNLGLDAVAETDVSNTFTANQIISVADNSNAALRITQTGTGNALVVEDSANPDNTPFVVNNVGSVGIGTSSVNAALHVNSTSSSLPFAIFEGGGSVIDNIALQLVDRGTASGNNNILEFGSINTDLDRIGIARVRAITQGNFAANGGDLVLETASNGLQTFNSNQIYLDNGGKVGIGTSSPSGKLDVYSNAGSTYINIARETKSQGQVALSLKGGSDGVNWVIYQETSSDDLRFYGNSAERMRINSSGNVGIGTSSPNSKLNVVTSSTDAAVTITQTGTGNALVVEDSANPDSTPFVVAASGNVGIGTTNPAAKLDVNGQIAITGSQKAFQFEKNDGSLDNVFYYDNSDATNALSVGRDSNAISLRTAGLTRLRIDSNGNVGIGTTSPAQKLDVNGNINATGALTLGTALAIAEGGTGSSTAAGARTNLGLAIGTNVQAYDSNLTSFVNTFTLPTSDGTADQVLTTDGSGTLSFQDAGGGGGTTSYLEHSDTISDSFTIASGTKRMYIGGTTFSGTISVAGKLMILFGEANFTGTINITGVLAILGVP